MGLILTLIVLVILGYCFYKFRTKDSDFFRQRGIKSLEPAFLLGNRPLFRNKLSVPEFIKICYDKFPNDKLFGLFDMGQPIIFLRDPELIKRLTVKDFDYFSDHRAIFDEKLDSLFGSSLVSLKGQKWRDMRSTLSPAFTGSKMRQMFELISICGDNLSKHFLLEAAKNNKLEYEMKDIFTRFANDVIATSAFGIQVDSFKDRNNEFYVTGKKLADFSSPLVIFKFIGHALMPKIMKFFKIRLVDSLISDYFTAIITSSMKYREENGIFRPDMLNLLMKVKQGKSETHPEEAANATTDGFATVEESSVGKAVVKTQWTDEELIAQCFIFFLAGFDAVSSAISYLAYEIAVNKDVEQKLYAEIEDINRQLNGQPLGYDTLQSMKYLDMVVSEALRKWAPSPVTDRICVKDYVYKDSDGLKFKIMKGDSCWIPTYGLHHDPKYFPNPRKFDPERFSDENKHNINMGAYQPFGSGPRNCIGSRFALMEVKTVFYYLVQNFTFEPTAKTQIPLKFAKQHFGIIPEKGVWLEFKPRKK